MNAHTIDHVFACLVLFPVALACASSLGARLFAFDSFSECARVNAREATIAVELARAAFELASHYERTAYSLNAYRMRYSVPRSASIVDLGSSAIVASVEAHARHSVALASAYRRQAVVMLASAAGIVPTGARSVRFASLAIGGVS